MSQIKRAAIITVAVLTLTGWSWVAFRLFVASGAISGPLATTWTGLARRHAWTHWVNGMPTVEHGKALLQAGQQFEIAVQPIAMCAQLVVTADSDGQIIFRSRDTGDLQPDNGFTAKSLPRAFDGYHFFLTAVTSQTVSSMTFTCRP